MPVGPLRQLQLEFRKPRAGRDVHAPDETGDEPALQLAPVAVVEDVLQRSVIDVKASLARKVARRIVCSPRRTALHTQCPCHSPREGSVGGRGLRATISLRPTKRCSETQRGYPGLTERGAIRGHVAAGALVAVELEEPVGVGRVDELLAHGRVYRQQRAGVTGKSQLGAGDGARGGARAPS